MDNRSNQLNSNNPSFWNSRGFSGTPSNAGKDAYNASHPPQNYPKDNVDNRANQLNRNNDAYYSSRGTTKK